MFKILPPKLIDCEFHPSGVAAELFIVEGDSASNAIGNIRDASYQAVMPMQGKPLNAWKASKEKVAKNEFFDALQLAIGAGWGDQFQIEKARYANLILVFDPDADGIHCSMLVLMYFYRWMRPMLDSGRILLIHAPLFEITAPGMTEMMCAITEEDAAEQLARVKATSHPNAIKKRYRGLASMNAAVLKRYCVQPATRQAIRMRAADAEAAIEVFCPKGF